MNVKWTENIGKEFIKDSQLELKDSFGWYVPLHKLPTDTKMAMPHIALNYLEECYGLNYEEKIKRSKKTHERMNNKRIGINGKIF